MSDMKYYFAPMEGITGHVFRNAHHKMFGEGIDAYFTPFLATNHTKNFKSREKEDVLPANNEGIPTVPQLLSKNSEEFLLAAKEMARLGYEEVNLNLGCPMPTVYSKGRGAGFLKYPKELNQFFEEVFDGIQEVLVLRDGEARPIKISIKTRLGAEDITEIPELFRIFASYPFSQVMIHARTRKQMYGGRPDLDAYQTAVSYLKVPVCYNGDIRSAKDLDSIKGRFSPDAVMIGRGLLANPALVREIQTGVKLTMEELREFHDMLFHDYQVYFASRRSGESVTIGKMKELWAYWGMSLEDDGRYLKNVHKAKNKAEYEAGVRMIFHNCAFKNACVRMEP